MRFLAIRSPCLVAVVALSILQVTLSQLTDPPALSVSQQLSSLNSALLSIDFRINTRIILPAAPQANYSAAFPKMTATLDFNGLFTAAGDFIHYASSINPLNLDDGNVIAYEYNQNIQHALGVVLTDLSTAIQDCNQGTECLKGLSSGYSSLNELNQNWDEAVFHLIGDSMICSQSSAIADSQSKLQQYWNTVKDKLSINIDANLRTPDECYKPVTSSAAPTVGIEVPKPPSTASPGPSRSSESRPTATTLPSDSSTYQKIGYTSALASSEIVTASGIPSNSALESKSQPGFISVSKSDQPQAPTQSEILKVNQAVIRAPGVALLILFLF